MDWASNPLMALGKKVFGIGGGNEPAVQHANFDVKMGLETYGISKGTIESSAPFPPFIVRLPVSNQSTGGLHVTDEMADFQLGVWTFSEVPKLEFKCSKVNYTGKGYYGTYDRSYRIEITNENSVSVIFNPKVLAILR